MKQTRWKDGLDSLNSRQADIHRIPGGLVAVLGLTFSVILCSDQSAVRAAQKTSSPDETGSRWITPAVQAPRLQQRFFQSAAAKAKVSYHIYTPAVYDTDKKRQFPVLYWLHGAGGGLPGLPKLVQHFDQAILAEKIPPILVVFPNGMPYGMWCNSKDGTLPVETVVIKELLPHIDATFRTVASRKGRMIEGFSMGGYGAARLGFKYADLFGTASILGAGPLQLEFTEAIGPRGKARDRKRILETVYGNDQSYFLSQSPWMLAKQNAAKIRGKLRVRQVVGDRDKMLVPNRELHAHLDRLFIPHTWTVPAGVRHNPLDVFHALEKTNWEFYREAFEGESQQSSKAKPKTYILTFGKSRVADPVRQQKIAKIAVRDIVESSKKCQPDIIVDALAEPVITKEEYLQGKVKETVTGDIFRNHLERLTEIATPQDTVIIYTHSHGCRNGFQDSQPLGGIMMDLPIRRSGPILWDEYVDRILEIPAKNVVVLTMACFSGGLVEYMNSPQVSKRWKDRQQKEGRNLIVLTSQCKDELSIPIVKDGRVINPFTYAVTKMFAGEADGFQLSHGKPITGGRKDGKLTVGELIDYTLYTTKHTPSEHVRRKNGAKPQVTGSYDRTSILRFGAH